MVYLENLRPCGLPEDVRTDIVHVDMDAFFAAVEQRDDPCLRSRPVVVGGSPDSRGVVSTCSYEARRYGIRSGMPSARARALCPEAVFCSPDFGRYREASDNIRRIMARYGDQLEPIGLDEAFLRVPGSLGDPVDVAHSLKSEIRKEVQLTCSVGISYNKPLAKLASEWEKPDGFTVIDADTAQRILPGVHLEDLWGVGPQTARELERRGIVTCSDFSSAPATLLIKALGAARAWDITLLCSGMHSGIVSSGGRSKSVSQERTLAYDVDDPRHLEDIVTGMVTDLGNRLREREMGAGTVTIKVRSNDFRTRTRSMTLPETTADDLKLRRTALDLLSRLFGDRMRIRLVGVGLSNLEHPDTPVQGELILRQ